MSVTHKKWAYLITLSIIWGSSYILIKKGLVGLTPLQLGSFRILFTTSILLLFGFNTLKGLTRAQWKWLAHTGFYGTFFPAFLFAFAETEVDSSVASVLNGLTPLFTLIFAFFFYQVRIVRKQVFGVLVGLFGTFLLVAQEFSFSTSNDPKYSLLVVCASVFYGINVNILKNKLSDVSPMAIALGNFLMIAPVALLILIFSEFNWTGFYEDEKITTSLGYILILSLVGTALAKVMFNRLLDLSSPVFAVSITYLLPIVAIGWGLVDGEIFGGLQWVAALLIICGVYLVTETKKAPK
jgi:drug/metabolite transporter (DMT)-like permease